MICPVINSFRFDCMGKEKIYHGYYYYNNSFDFFRVPLADDLSLDTK